MSVKEEFTKIIEEKSAVAKLPPQKLSSEKVVDGAGPIILNDRGESGYDLRRVEEKGVLPPCHPVLLGSKLNPRPVPDKIPLIEELKTKTRAGSAGIAEMERPPQNNMYRSASAFAPLEGFDAQKAPLLVPLEGHTVLVLAKDRHELEKTGAKRFSPFWAAYFEFAGAVLINKGIGRLADIEKILRRECPSDWDVGGCRVFIPHQVDKARFHAEGLLITDKNLDAKGVEAAIPISVYDDQLIDIAARIKRAVG